MTMKKFFRTFLKTTMLLILALALLFLGLTLNMLYPFEKTNIAPGSAWVMAVDREVRQMPTPAGAELLSYATKGDGVHLLGYDAARYKWTRNPTDFEEWGSYWKKLGYTQIDHDRSDCMSTGLQALFTKNYRHISICHNPQTMTTWIEKTS